MLNEIKFTKYEFNYPHNEILSFSKIESHSWGIQKILMPKQNKSWLF